jgi:hypothetical protein
MRRLIIPTAMIFIAVLVVLCLGADPSFAQKDGEKPKSGSDKVKLETNQVEVVELSQTAEKCANQKGASLRLKVLSESPIDVRILYQNNRGRWNASNISGKKRGDEIAEFTCFQDSRFRVQARTASDKPWPNP